MRIALCAVGVLSASLVAGPAEQTTPASMTYFVGATVLSRPDRPDIPNAAITVRDGRIYGVVPRGSSPVPDGVRVVDVTGKYVIPGLISAHSHVPDLNGTETRARREENTLRQLRVFARYGVTTVWSLGGEQETAFEARDTQNTPSLDRARIYVAGNVITAKTPEDARQAVATVAALKPDVIKIRVDDNLGAATKMPPDVYRAVIDEAHRRGLRVAAHIFYLEDAKDLLRAGVDVIAHSVRDREIDAEFISLMKARNVPYCPTLTRELSTFVYESVPEFFSDPFFLRDADPAVVADLKQPARQQAMRASKTAQAYKAALPIALRNLKRAADAGIAIIMGTDSGPSPERFQGYFEHLEMAMMAEAGLTPVQILRASTFEPARAMRLDGRDGTGTLIVGSWADFVVLDRDPRQDIRNTRSIASVWVAGNQIKR